MTCCWRCRENGYAWCTNVRCACHHHCSNCYVASYGIKSDIPCRNEAP